MTNSIPATANIGSTLRVGPAIAPDFVVIGAAKAGTTSLAACLAQHPRIAMAGGEPEYFCREAPDAESTRAYEALWAGAKADQLRGEKSTGYTRLPEIGGVPARLAAACPDARLIYAVRHPIDRAYSHYLHRCRKELYPGRPIPHPFERHAELDPMVLNGSDYRLQIEAWLKQFPRERLHVIVFEEFIADPDGVMEGVQRFLGLPRHVLTREGPPEANIGRRFDEHLVRWRALAPARRLGPLWRARRVVPRAWREAAWTAIRRSRYGRNIEAQHEASPMRAETRRALAERFNDSNLWLGEFIGRDLSHWNA